MSRYSPTVAPNSGEAFGRALQQSVSAYLGARQQKQQDEADMFGHGYMPYSAPAPGPSPAPQAPAIDQGALNTLVAHNTPAEPDPSPAGHAFGQMLGAQALPIQVAQSRPEPQGATSASLAKAAGLDAYQPQQPAPVHLYGRDWSMTPAALASMQMSQATARAALEHTGSETAKNYREMTKPQLGDPNYTALSGDEAAAKAAATLPYDMAKTRGTMGLERTPEKLLVDGQPIQGFADKMGNYFDSTGKPIAGKVTPYVDPESRGLRELAMTEREQNMNTRNEARLVQQYRDATGKYSQTADALQAIAENRAGALKGDPIAQQTLLQDFIKLNLPGQQVTEGELGHYMYLMGLGEKGEQLLNKLRQGTPLGTEQVKLILEHADNLAKERRKGADYLRQQYIGRGARANVPESAFPDWFGFLPGENVPPPPPPAAPGTRPLGDTSGRTVVVNGKTFVVPH